MTDSNQTADQVRPLIVDCDTHFWQPIELWQDYIEDEHHRQSLIELVKNTEFEMEHITELASGPRQIRGGDHAKERLEWMDSEGVDVCIIFPTDAAYLTFLDDAALASAACRALNRWSAEFASMAPERLKPCMLLPWYYPEHALEEFRYARQLGLEVAFAPPTPSPKHRWSDPVYEPLWAELEENHVVLCMHEFTRIPESLSTVLARPIYSDQFAMLYLCGHTVEAQLALMDLMIGGVFGRHPGLQIGFAEAHIAWLPGWLRLMDDQWPKLMTDLHKENVSSVGDESQPATELFRRQGFIVGFPDDAWVEETIQHIGVENVMMSTDYPHFQTRYNLKEMFEQYHSELDEASKSLLLGGNAARVFRLN